ncbi:acetoacetate--CoA ligase (plasmid) [Photobacterium sp. DA100]|uniref:acetoacetate--CoA ligase n=1 Tax=Photobacterium sp. DA100 TaxID=3027472 RepID=UPI00247893C8|nr:acetoacetate--CoA ligase [Photobacterium sp. DA100]WEM44277.1 acetoacetate--CoA ligase [Photobacterium sp. DA100]
MTNQDPNGNGYHSDTQPKLLWMPEKDRIHNSRLYQFMVELSEKKNILYHDYNQLHHWSVSHSEEFWSMVWDFCKVEGAKKPPVAFCPPESTTPAKDTQWFPYAKLNYAENLLRDWRTRAAADAIIFQCEGDPEQRQHLSWQQLYRQTSQVASFLHNHGVKKGDVVAGYLPNIPQTVVAMLATASLGAIWTSTSPDFGTESVIERFGQTQPKVLFFAQGYQYNGKPVSYRDKVAEVSASIPGLEHVVEISAVAPSPGQSTKTAIPDTVSQHFWHDILDSTVPCELGFTPVPFDHPLYILYSSGTTGKPKCIVHSVGGTLLNHLKEHQLQTDIRSGDRVFFFTTCGWMMWNWLVSGLACGATLVLYDGSPFYPDGNVLWQLAEQEQITLFGTSAKYLETLEKQGYRPKDNTDLSSLRTLCSTGSVLAPEQFDYVYDAIHDDIQLASISGGTDICGCFAIGNPLGPVYRGECQGLALGMDVQVFNDNGQAIYQQQGELVCRNSFPNQPVGFWNDPDGSKYHNAYWNSFPGVWHHGDFVSLSSTGGMVFYGRSDAVLNPSGIRIGTAEIYRQVNRLEEVKDSLVIGQNKGTDVRVVLFVQLTEGEQLTDELKARIQKTIREHCSPRHVPEVILAVKDVPRTKSGKLVELAVRNIVHNQPVKNIGALANPESLEEFKDRDELKI